MALLPATAADGRLLLDNVSWSEYLALLDETALVRAFRAWVHSRPGP